MNKGAGLVLILVGATVAIAQQRTVAITVDDLPYVDAASTDPPWMAQLVNRRLLAAFRSHRVPVTGFVIQKRAEELGPTGPRILRAWIEAGLDLGNHTYSHPDVNGLTVAQIEDEIIRGETAIGPLMRGAGRKLSFFRFPYNHTGDTESKRGAIAVFLATRGYRVATCTIDNSDYVFNNAWVRLLAKNDKAAAAKVERAYLDYTSAEVDYYATLNRQVFGYDPPQVMLLHDNRLNAGLIDKILRIFEVKQYKLVTLETAQSDAAYRTPDTYITKFGPMWGYRWARERDIKVNGKLEPDPPAWIVEEAGEKP